MPKLCLSENKNRFCEENFPLIHGYTDTFRICTFAYGNGDFEALRSDLIYLRNQISDRFKIEIHEVCKFAFSYIEMTHLINGVFTRSEHDYLYFIKGGKYIKIGRTSDLRTRLSALQVSSPDKLSYIEAFPGRGCYEFLIHDLFHHIRVKGEWFIDTVELRGYIKKLSLNNSDLSNKSLFYGE